MRVLLLILALLLAALQAKLWYGSGGQREVAALKVQVATQTAENRKLQARNDALAAEVADLKAGGEAVEERARSELGMVKPGETFYRVIDGAKAGATRGGAANAPAPLPADSDGTPP